jgi:hypothetical protein
MNAITYRRSRITDLWEIFRPKGSPIIHNAGTRQRSVKVSPGQTIKRSYSPLRKCEFYTPYAIFFDRTLRSSFLTKSSCFKCMQDNLLLTFCRQDARASWNDMSITRRAAVDSQMLWPKVPVIYILTSPVCIGNIFHYGLSLSLSLKCTCRF